MNTALKSPVYLVEIAKMVPSENNRWMHTDVLGLFNNERGEMRCFYYWEK